MTRERVVPCALQGSPLLPVERHGIAAAEGRAMAARSLLPANPALAMTLGQRPATRAEPDSLAWSLSLSQELEIAGQRGLRHAEREAETTAARARAGHVAREVSAQALVAYFDAVATAEAVQLALRLEGFAEMGARAARARADRGLSSRVEADVADAAVVRARKGRLAAENARRQAQVLLAMRLGRDPSSPTVAEGALDPLSAPAEGEAALALGAAQRSPAVAALGAEAQAHKARERVLARERVPSPTVSAIAQTDGADGRVFSIGLSFPIPLPHPVGRTNAGEMAEARALAERARSEADARGRMIHAEVLTAASVLSQQRAAVAATSPEQLRRAEEALRDIAVEIEAGRLPIRDALLLQQGLVELLTSHLESRRALCLASVELLRAAGLPLGGGAP